MRNRAALRSGTDNNPVRVTTDQTASWKTSPSVNRRPERITDTPVPHWRGRPATLRFHGPISGCEHQTVALRDERSGGARLGARTLLVEQEFTAGVVDAGRAEIDHDLCSAHAPPSARGFTSAELAERSPKELLTSENCPFSDARTMDDDVIHTVFSPELDPYRLCWPDQVVASGVVGC